MSDLSERLKKAGMSRAGRLVRLVAVVVLAVTCGRSDSSVLLGPVVNPLDQAMVQLAPQAVTLSSGGSYQFEAVAILPDNSQIVPDVIWTATGGTISATGLFTAGTAPGTYQVSAQIRNHRRSGSAPVTVAPVTLTVLTLSPSTTTLASGASQQFTVAGIWSDGTTSAPAVMYSAAGGTISASGLYTAGTTPGTFRVVATQQGGTKVDTAVVTITAAPPTLTQMVLSPAALSLTTGSTGQFSVTGTWSDGTTTAPAVTYSATGGSISASGLYTAGTTPGSFRVIASRQGGTKVDSAVVTITALPPTLTQMVLNPASLSLAVGATGQFSVTGTWSDGTSTAPAVTYSATGGTITPTGLYTAGTTAGTFRVIATQQGGTKVDTAAVTIIALPATLTQMVLSPASLSLATGATGQFSVTGTWSDGTTTAPAVTYSATGGSINANGLYTAGATAGTYRVIAMQQGGARADTSTVVVAPANTSLLTFLDRAFYTQGQYGAYASPWSTVYDSTLKRGIDYSDSIIVNPRTFTDSSIIGWRWPNRSSTATGVWGYMSVWFGNYDGGEPAVQVTPRQVKNITTLRQDFSLSPISSGSFNILNEFYLTSQAGNSAAKVIEIGYFLHSSTEASTFFSTGQPIGSYLDASGQMWDARIQGTFCMLIPRAGTDVLTGSIDVKAMLAFLTTKGVITGNEWFNGIALGVEPVSGSGELRIGRWSVTYD